MHSNSLLKAAVLALVLVALSVTAWEVWLRHKGYSVSYDDNSQLWADKRGKVYQPKDKAVVFIGSSRIKFDLDVPTWEKATGTNAVQLAMVGSSPRPILKHLANDPNFKGKLVVDVTEGLFFSEGRGHGNQVGRNTEYYDKYSPSQKASFQINSFFESNLVCLDYDYFSMNACFGKLPTKNRKGVIAPPPFPWEFDLSTFDRQSKMADRFLTDTNLQKQVQGIWAYGTKRRQQKGDKPASGKKLDSMFHSVKADVAKIKARGGEVFFVRTPSDGPFWAGEKMAFPREKYWDRLLAETGCAGIHFVDYKSLSNFKCPEFSHLSPADAKVFTREFVHLLREKGFLPLSSIAAR